MASNSRYEVIIFWSDEDDSFVAEVPELPGCMADGATYQEAVANTESAIRDWLDTAVQLGRSIPKPKGRLQYA
jgi:predicted RNase H-like HicB family nuclease